MKVFASDPPEHKSKSHNTTHTHRNHPNLATFRTGRWCNLEIAQLIVLICPVCAHPQTRALFGVWLIVKIVICVTHYIIVSVRTYVLPPIRSRLRARDFSLEVCFECLCPLFPVEEFVCCINRTRD